MSKKTQEEAAESCFLNEDGLSRLQTHTQDKDTYAVIGTQDKDTKEDIFSVLISEIRKVNNKNIEFNRLEGTYTYDNGEMFAENGLIIYNVCKEDAIRIGKKLNQEYIIWKDPNFFGFVYMDGRPDEKTAKSVSSFDKEMVKAYGSRLKNIFNNAKPFVFEATLIETTNRGNNFSRQKKAEIVKYQLFKIRVDN